MTTQALLARPPVAGRMARPAIDVANVSAIATVNVLLVAAVYALTQCLPGWAAGVVVSAAVGLATVIAGAVGDSKRAKALPPGRPLGVP
jgi:hypothetical protein